MKLLTIYEVADRLGLSHQRVRQLVDQGRLSAEKVGRDWVVREADLAKADLSDKRRRSKTPPPSGTVTVTEASVALGVTRQRAYDFINEGRLDVVRLGPRSTFVTKGSLNRLIEEREEATGQDTPRPFGAPVPEDKAE